MATTTAREHLISILRDFDSGMLVTRGEDEQMHARPMLLAHVDDSATVWLVAERRSEKAQQVQEDRHVALTLQGEQRYLALHGSGKLHRDAAQLQRIWRDALAQWFPAGPNDPNLCALAVVPQIAEFWDYSKANSARWLYEAARAYLPAGLPALDASEHAKLEMEQTQHARGDAAARS